VVGRYAERGDDHHRRPLSVSRGDAVLLVVGVAAVSTSAPLVKEAAAPALAIAFWRNAFAAGGLAPVALGKKSRGAAAPRSAWLMSVLAGALLGLHFSSWIASLSLTSVAASVALVSTQPVWAALLGRLSGERISRGGWLGIGLALAGVVIATGTAAGGSGRALRGDLLALVGGVCAAAYVSCGTVARRRLSTTDYTAVCYTVAAVVVLALALVSGQRLTGFGSTAWLCIVAITVGPQLLGHSTFNRLLRTVGPTVVSVAVLGEIVGATLLAAWWFGERPSVALLPAAVCIAAGVVLVVRGRRPVEVVAG
jgi:drug/metabolite transporter (DMT)-like permease